MLGIVIALMLTFFISGVWHGAALTFIFWGLLQGLFLSIEAITNKQRRSFFKKHDLAKKGWFIFASCVFTYLLFAFSELFCGPVDSMQKAFFIIGKIFSNFISPVYFGSLSTIIFVLLGILILFSVEWQMEYRQGGLPFLNNKNWVIRKLSYAVLIIIILLIGVFDGGQFIYFRF
jgi:D-alanyl-lipoteichoic acid acyltransferase DltB (MBOAT superfamily)